MEVGGAAATLELSESGMKEERHIQELQVIFWSFCYCRLCIMKVDYEGISLKQSIVKMDPYTYFFS